ncbi:MULTISPECIES: ADP-ribosylglycohydrolase family protein [Dermacoccus]|uniref:ADP-ribosylglycohydrolase family protein n=2 Tax=Dermacoccus TaxID=57495 RepID=A0A417Z4J4_9MICO|nr:ADP-ribosylglycohydrolase family protein [Dermacoccus abyssi]RHW45209.1 ADP-ribosylglycohydrolase family protein [Dermacoccus abyssi]
MPSTPGGVTALDDRELTAANARRVAELTHADPLVLDSCVLHAEAVRRGVLTGEYDLLAGLDLLPEERRGQWVSWLESATRADASTIEANGSTFGALRAAHAAITSARAAFRGRDGEALLVVRAALETAASAGHDTDTVAAITGALLGAVYGVSAIPATWRRRIHGWPGLRARDLVELALRTAGEAPADAWPRRAHEPEITSRPAVTVAFDGGLRLGTQSCLTTTDADAVVSLSRIGSAERLFADYPERHVEFWLVDSDDPATHNDLAATLIDAADVVAELRSQGHHVLLHCVHAHHRTPSVALVYAEVPLADDGRRSRTDPPGPRRHRDRRTALADRAGGGPRHRSAPRFGSRDGVTRGGDGRRPRPPPDAPLIAGQTSLRLGSHRLDPRAANSAQRREVTMPPHSRHVPTRRLREQRHAPAGGHHARTHRHDLDARDDDAPRTGCDAARRRAHRPR